MSVVFSKSGKKTNKLINEWAADLINSVVQNIDNNGEKVDIYC
jgi:hypothetical protein